MGVPDLAASRWTPIDSEPFLETDERIYLALVEQLHSGQGYTLQGHGILEELSLPVEQYDRSLFYHPPAGVACFWLSYLLFGQAGYALVIAAGLLLGAASLVKLTAFLVVPGVAAFTWGALPQADRGRRMSRWA